MCVYSFIVLIITICGAGFMISNKSKKDVNDVLPYDLPESEKTSLSDEITKKYKPVFYTSLVLLIFASLAVILDITMFYKYKITGNLVWIVRYILPALVGIASVILMVYASILGYIIIEPDTEEGFRTRRYKYGRSKSSSIPKGALFRKSYVPGVALTVGSIGFLATILRYRGL